MASLPALNRQRQALPLAGRLEACSSTVAQWSRSTCNIQNMELRQSLQGHEGCVNALCWSPDGQYLFSGSDDSTICIWRAASDGSRICKIKTGFAERVFDLKVMPAPNDHLLIACSMDHSIKIFDIHRILLAASGTEGSAVIGPADFCIRTFTAHSSPVKRAAPIPDSPNQFLSCSEDGTARHYDIREPPRRSPGHPDGSRIVADYHMIHAELHALDVNPFYTHSFAVGGTMLSIMVHDLRMPRVSSMPQRRCDSCGQDVASSGCVVRLRRGRAKDRREVFEKATQNPVTGLRFSRDVPNQIIGSWCYDYVYLFDLNQSQTYMHSLAAREAPSPSKVSGDGRLARRRQQVAGVRD
ncbi:hypothetical protein EC988_001659 [Linderina pennispora]|nr:hypothetical protein EC988_001659 [Linderina pennispora]